MAPPFAFDFRVRNPEPPLGRFVESIWYARGTIPYARERIAPTGSTVGIFVLGDPILETADDGRGETFRAERTMVIGPHDRPVINEPTGETFALGIVTTPIGAEAVFGIRPASIRGQVVDLEQVWPIAETLRDGLLACPDGDDALTWLEGRVAHVLNPNIVGVERCEAAVSLLERDPNRMIADIADELAISHGHLDREFTRIVGLTPRSIARLLRMRRLLSGIDVNGDVGWVDVATELGWFDQAHLIRDFKRHTGVTPTEYLDAQRAVYAPVEAGDAAGFVPEV